jgi:chemotaxis protein histidine kinase CheA
VITWVNKKKAKAMAKMEEKLKAESLARARAEERLKEEIEKRASVERKVKAEAEKMLLTQYRNYSVMAERAEAQAKKEIAAAKAEAKEAVEKAQSYEEALSKLEEKLTKAQEQAKTEAIARAKVEEGLKAEREKRQSLDAQVKEEIAAVKAQAEEEIRSYATALAQAEEKLSEAKEKARAEVIASAKAEEGLLVSAKDEVAAGKAKSKEPQSLDAQPPQKIKTFKLFHRHIFHLKTAKRKFALFLALAILSVIALTFGVSVVNDAPVAEPGIAMTQEEKPVPITLNDTPLVTSAPVTTATAGALYTYDVDAEDPDLGDVLTYSLTTKPADMTINSTTGLIQWKPTEVGDNKVVVKVADSNSTPALDTQSFTIKVNPPPPKITKLTVLDGYNQRNRKTLSAEGKANLVQSSDNNRWPTVYCSYVSYDFSNVSIPPDAAIKSVVVRVEHFEEEGFAQGKLDWTIGTGWPNKPVIWASIKAPVHEEEHHEAVDSWDVTSIADTREKINSLQLQIKNNDKIAQRKTLIDYTYVVVEWD